MRNLSLILVLLFIGSALYGQELQHFNSRSKDKIAVNKTWKKFKKALECKDKKNLRLLSLKRVDCDLFQAPPPEDSHEQDIANSYISIDTFLVRFYADLPKLKLWSVMKYKKYRIGEIAYNDFHPPNIQYQKSKSFKVSCIWYTIFEPNEITKGDEGESEAFEFVKINGKFKFYGLTSIP